MKTYKIHLIRSSYTKSNLEGRYIGHTDEELCAEGLAGIEQLLQEAKYPEAEVVLTSPLKRCVETCEKIYPEKTATPVRELIECDFGEFDGLSAQELEKYPEFAEWLKGGADAAPPHGESGGEFSRRVCSCFIKIVDGMLSTGITNTAIVTHGGVIMTLLAAFGLPEMPSHEWRMPPACGYTLNIIPSIWVNSRKAEVFAEIPRRTENPDEHGDFT